MLDAFKSQPEEMVTRRVTWRVTWLVAMLVIGMYAVWTIWTRRTRPVVPPPKVSTEWRAANVQRAQQTSPPPPPHPLDEFIGIHLNWYQVIGMGDVYAKGSYPRYKPNVPVAASLYRCVIERCPDDSIVATARAKLADAFRHPLDDDDVSGRELDTRYATDIIRRIMAMPKPRQPPQRPPPPQRPQHPPPPQRPLPRRPDVRNDLQNVHDHGVTSGLKAMVQALRDTHNAHGAEAVEDPRPTIQAAIDSLGPESLTSDERAHAEMVLGSLGANTLGSVGASELEAAHLVWKSIDETSDVDMRQNQIESLAKQLASGVEHGIVVCGTGKAARILGTLDGTLTTLTPLWAVKEELATLAARTRDDGHDGRAFRERATRIYVDELGMSPDVVNPLIDMYALGFDE